MFLLRAALVSLLFATPVAVLVPAPDAHAAVVAPQTIPALRHWSSGAGSYLFTAASRLVLDPDFAAQLQDEAATFATDLGLVKGRGVAVEHGDAVAGDIRLTLGGNEPAEGYTITVGSSVSIQASTDSGAFWATRTLLQLLRRGDTLPAGTAVDAPTKPERGLMLDVGRKFFSVDWLEKQIRAMSSLKLNRLHLHLSDNQGFRLESRTHPEVVSDAHYTYQDIRELVALGDEYHVTIVPEIDMPGHMATILAAHPDLKLVSADGAVNPNFIDLSKSGAYTLMQDLITEYLPLFPGKYWHLGADEYIENYAAYPQLLAYARARYGPTATAKDAYYGFINWANTIVRGAGKDMRMWNDGIKAGDGTVDPSPTIVVEYWADSGLRPQELLERGHAIANESWDPTYYILGGTKPDNAWGYETWTPDLFQGGTTIATPARNLGTNVHVWCDNPAAETESQVAKGIYFPLRVIAQQTWGTPKVAPTYAAFVGLATQIDPIAATPTGSGRLTAGRNADGRLQAFALRGGSVSSIWQTAADNAWSPWFGMGGNDIRQSVAASHVDGRIELMVVGGDGRLYHKWQTSTNSGFSEWHSLGGTALSTDLAVGANADGRLQAFVVGGDGALYTIWQTASGGWSSWLGLGGTQLRHPAVASNSDGRLEVTVIGANGSLLNNWQTEPNGGFAGWASLGGNALADLTVAANADGRLQAFAVGGNGVLYSNWQLATGGWSGWQNLGGTQLHRPVATSNGDGRIEVMVIGGDGMVYHKWQTSPNGPFSDWANLGGAASNTDLAVVTNTDGRPQAFVIGTDGALYTTRQLITGGWSGWQNLR